MRQYNEPFGYVYLGIDLGSNGGVAFYYKNTNQYYQSSFAFSQMSWQGVKERLKQNIDFIFENNGLAPRAIIETVNGRHEQGSSNSFSWGVSCGRVYQMIDDLNIPYISIQPKVWQKGLLLDIQTKGMTKKDRKNFYKQKAIELFPSTKINLKTADAYLMAYYGMRNADKHLFVSPDQKYKDK